MAYTLWGEPGSGSFMVEAALAEAGEAVTLVDIDIKADEQLGEAYRAVNPVGKVPALKWPDGEVMTQSAAILIALGERYPETRLMPTAEDPDRHHALRWLVHLATEIYPLIEIFDYPDRFVPPDVVDVAVRSRIRSRLRERWQMVESAAASPTSFLLAGFSALDLAIAVMSRWDIGPEWRAKECPKLDGIALAIATRPRIERIWQRHFPAP